MLLLVLGAVPVAAGTGEPYRGRPLIEVLEELRDAGLHLIFSSAVVSPDSVVTEEPSTVDPRGILDQILPPLGLVARGGPGDSILIVRRPNEESPTFSIEVTVIPGQRSVLRDPLASTHTVEASAMRRVPDGSGDPLRVVDQLPGVVTEDGAGSPNIRGSLSGDTSLVLDGMELYEPYHLQAIQSPFSVIDGRSVDRIELLSGGMTAEYGDRHGAFVEVTTRSSFSEPHGELEVGTLNSRVSYSAPSANGNGSWLVTLREWYPEGPFDTQVFGQGKRLRPRFRDGYAKFDWSVSPRMLLSAHALLANDELGFDESQPEGREAISAETESGYFWMQMFYAWSDEITTKTVLSGGQTERWRDGTAEPDRGVVFVRDTRKLDFVGFTQDVVWNVTGRQLLKAGVYGRRLQADYRYSATLDGEPTGRSVELYPAGLSFGAYVAHRTQVSRRVATELGLRWDGQDYTDDHQLSPRFNLLWKTGRGGEFRLALGRFHQSQRIGELAVADGETEFRPAELSEQLELAYQQRIGRELLFRLDAYDRKLSDLRPRYENLYQPRDLFPEISEDRVRVAPDSARLRGIELSLQDSSASPLTWRLGYAYSSAQDEIDGRSVPRRWDQPHAVSALVAYDWRDRWFLSLGGVARSGRPTTRLEIDPAGDPAGDPALVPGETNSARLPTYMRLDLEVRRTFAVPRGRLSLTLDLLNVTDRRNACCVDDVTVATGSDGTPRVETQYEYWRGFAPMFGILWEF